MDISYVHTCKRKDLGQPCSFTDVGPHLLAEVDSDPVLKAKFYTVPSIDKEVDNCVKMCAQEVNTVSSTTENRGMNHKEGGWPTGIDIEDEDSKARFRKMAEKDKNYTTAVERLGALVETMVMVNNSIDVYEEYFADDRIKLKCETTFQTVSVACDPNDTTRKVMDLSWSADSSKVAGAYVVEGDSGCYSVVGVDSYVWDIGNSANPYCVLKPESCLTCVEFSPIDDNLLMGGYVTGQVALWDVRIAGPAQQVSEVKEGHIQKVIGIKWLATKTSMDFFSVSVDGRIMSWDARDLSKPTEKIHLSPNSIPSLDQEYVASCAEANKSLPDYFMLGTEQGKVLSFCRQNTSEDDIDFSSYDCKCGPILKIERNPQFPTLFAACDPYSTKLWVEKKTESPVLSLASGGVEFCTDFCWSPTRASLLYVAKTSGVVEVWDILGQHFRPTTSVKLDDGSLKSVCVNPSGEQLACGTGSGKIHLMMIPEKYRSSSDVELSLMATSVGGEKEPLNRTEPSETSPKNEDGIEPTEKTEEEYKTTEKLFIPFRQED